MEVLTFPSPPATALSFEFSMPPMCCVADWPSIFTSTLAESPLYANLGVTGPYDINNPRILTHAFVHRTHLDIFEGHFFPEVRVKHQSDRAGGKDSKPK